MNNKGFTLIEMLAVIVILGLIMGIASYSIINTINNSKKNSEKIFVDKVSNLIDEYLSIYGSNLSPTDVKVIFEKCQDKNCSSEYYSTATELTSIHLDDLVKKNLVDESKLVNPANNKKCLENGKNPEIIIYKDDEYVYYYYTDLGEDKTNCNISKENGIIDTRPQSLKNKIEEDVEESDEEVEEQIAY